MTIEQATMTRDSGVTAPPDDAAACQVVWADFTAGRGVRWGSWTRTKAGKQKLKYPEPRTLVVVPAEVPTDRHVAAHTYDEGGFTRWLPVDLDVKNGADAGDLVPVVFELDQLLGRVGGRYVWDQSETSEGMHVLIPLAEAAHHDEVAPAIRGLQRWARQWADVVDTRPALGPGGACITLPGTIDKGQIPRRLQQDPAEVIAAVRERSEPGLLGRLAEALAEFMTEPAPVAAKSFVPAPRTSGGETLLQAFARGGILPGKYSSSSEARQGAIRSLAGAGYGQEELWDAIGDGTFAGIADSYLHNYPSLSAARKLFDREWVKAVTGMGPVVKAGPTSTRWMLRAIFAAIRIEAGLASTAAARSRVDMLQAAAFMAVLAGSLDINVGCRAITFAAGLPSHSGIAAWMNIENAAEDSFVTKVSRHGRDTGTRWRLRLPARYSYLLDEAYRDQVKATQIEPVHTVYSVLGRSARWLLEALEQHGPMARLQLISRSGVSESHVDKLLGRLVEAGLVTRDVDGTVRRTKLDLDKAAGRLGVPGLVQARREKYAEQRAEWRKFWDQVMAATAAAEDEDEPVEEDWSTAPTWANPDSPLAGADPPF